MNNMIITFEDGSKKEYRRGTKFGEIVQDAAAGRDIICGSFNNIIVNYDDPIAKSGKLTLFDINTPYGNRVYEKGLTFLFKVCATEILGNDRVVRIRHSIDRVCYNADKQLLEEIFGASYNSQKNKIIPSEFISTIVDKIRMEIA